MNNKLFIGREAKVHTCLKLKEFGTKGAELCYEGLYC